MPSEKSARNKTLDFDSAQCAEFAGRCIKFHDGMRFSELEAENSALSFITSIENKTIAGDSFAVMEHLPKEFVSLAIVDPPYNLSKKYGEKSFSKVSRESYFLYTKKWISLLLPLLRKNASLYVCCDWKSSIIIADVLSALEKEKKLFIRSRITWQREKGRGAKSNWKNALEDIWFCTVSQNYIFNLESVKVRRKVIAPYRINGNPKDWIEGKTAAQNFRDTCPGNFWDDISIPFWSMAENTAHPTQKPEKLIAKLILASSNEGDVVFDPFLGSGTTSVVAKKLNRRYVGIEQNMQYCCWAEKRLADADQDRRIQGYSDGVFWERNSFPRG